MIKLIYNNVNWHLFKNEDVYILHSNKLHLLKYNITKLLPGEIIILTYE